MFGLYCIYDNAVKEFGFPFTAKNDVAARRVYVTSVTKWPDYEDDFVLYKLGEWRPEEDVKPIFVYPAPVKVNVED